MVVQLIQFLFSLLTGVASFGIARYFQFEAPIAFVIGLGTAILAFIGTSLDYVKKFLEVGKLTREYQKLGREAKEAEAIRQSKDRLVQLPTPEELKKYGVSLLERKLEIYSQVEGEKERLEVQNFIAEIREKKVK